MLVVSQYGSKLVFTALEPPKLRGYERPFVGAEYLNGEDIRESFRREHKFVEPL